MSTLADVDKDRRGRGLINPSKKMSQTLSAEATTGNIAGSKSLEQ